MARYVARPAAVGLGGDRRRLAPAAAGVDRRDGRRGEPGSRGRQPEHRGRVDPEGPESPRSNIDCLYYRGIAGGRPFGGCIDFNSLPAASEIESGAVEVHDEDWRELVIDLGPGGVVTRVWERVYVPPEGWWFGVWWW